ncbi:MAG: esterase [Rhizobacter sp.]|nr:esterase [Rhizobacter sp.]
MLYELYEAQRALMSPLAEFASASSKLYSNPMSPFAKAPMADRVSAGFDLMNRLAKEYEKPPFDITSVTMHGVEVVIQEQVALEKPFCRLLRFKRFADDSKLLNEMKDQPTVLLVAPLSGHHATLLRETVKAMLQDHKVFITDWTDARMVPLEAGPFRLDDYIAYVQEFIRHIGPDVHVISVCQPTVPVLAAISLMASAGEVTPRSMTMMGGPIDARKSPTAVNNLATNKPYSWFENNVIFKVPSNFPGAGRAVYPGFLQHTGFVAMNPDRHAKSHYDYFNDLIKGADESVEQHRTFYDEYNAVLDMPAEYYLDTIRTVFQDFSLVNGTWEVAGHLVKPQDIMTTALLTIEGELDDISGAGQTRAAHDLCTGIPANKQFHYDAMGAGHYGIFSGRRWREKVYPEVRSFIAKYDADSAAKAKLSRSAPVEAIGQSDAAAETAAISGPASLSKATHTSIAKTPTKTSIATKASAEGGRSLVTGKALAVSRPTANAKPAAKRAPVKSAGRRKTA